VAAVVVLATTVTALTLVGVTQPLVQTEGITGLISQARYQGAPTDVGITQYFQEELSTGAVQLLTLLIEPSLTVGELLFAGYVPRDGERVVSRVDTVLNTAAFVQNSSVPAPPWLPPDQQPTGRTLLQLAVSVGDTLGQYPYNDATLAMCITAFANGQDPSIYADCDNGVTTSQLNTLATLSTGVQTAYSKLQTGIGSFDTTTLQEAAGLQNQSLLFQDWENITTTRIGTLQLQTNLTAATVIAVTTSAASKADNTTQQLKTILSNVQAQGSALLAAISGINSTYATLQRQQVSAFVQFASVLANYGAQVTLDTATQANLVRQIQVGLLYRQTTLIAWTVDQDMVRSQNYQLQQQFAQFATTPNARGVLLVPFTSDPGTPPATDPANLDTSVNHRRMGDDVIRGTGVDPVSGAPLGIATRPVYSCESNFLVHTAPSGPGSQDAIEWIGPPGCDATWEDHSNLCQCGGVLSEFKCVLENVNNVPTPAALLAWDNGTTNVDTTTGCVAAGVPFLPAQGGLHGASLNSFQTTASFIATIAARPTYQRRPYQLVSVLLQLQKPVSYVAALQNATLFSTYAFPLDPTLFDNIAYAWASNLPNEYMVSYNYIGSTLRGVVDGLPPLFTTQSSTLYERLQGGNTGRGTKWTIMMYSNELLVVSRYIQSNYVTSVQYAVGSGGATQTALDIVVSNPYLVDIPGSFYQAIDPAAFTETWYNIPQSEFSLSPYARWRWDTVTTAIFPSRSEVGQDYYQVQNGIPFNQEAGGNVPAIYVTSLDSVPTSPTYGQCVGTTLVGGGPDCTLRDHFLYTITGDLEDPNVQGQGVFSAYDDETAFTLVLNGGPLLAMAQSKCPVIQSLGDSSTGEELTLVLSNSLGAEDILQAKDTGACPFTETVTIPAGGTATLHVATCPLSSPDAPDQLSFSYTFQGTSIACIGTTINLTAPDTTTLPASANFTVALHTTTVDLTQIEAQRQASAAFRLLYAVGAAMVQYTPSVLGFATPNVTQTNFNALLSSIGAASANVSLQIAQTANETADLSALEVADEAEIAALSVTQTQQAAQQQEDLDNIAAITAGNTLTLISMNQIQAYVDSTFAVVLLYTGLFAQAVASALQGALVLDANYLEITAVGVGPVGSSTSIWGKMASGFLQIIALGPAAVTATFNGMKSLNDNAVSGLASSSVFQIILTVLILVAVIAGVLFCLPKIISCARQCGRSARTTTAQVSPGFASIRSRLAAEREFRLRSRAQAQPGSV